MNKNLSYISISFSIFACAISAITYLKVYDLQTSDVPRRVDAIQLKGTSEGDDIFVYGYLIKPNKFYELHYSEESAGFAEPSTIMKMTVMHPPDNIRNSCRDSWVSISGVADWTGWGDSIDLISTMRSLRSGENCLVSESQPIKYTDVIANEASS